MLHDVLEALRSTSRHTFTFTFYTSCRTHILPINGLCFYGLCRPHLRPL